MGSQLRKLRAKAGITGLAHQKREREAYRLRERARRAERAKLELGDGFAIVGVNSPGGQMRSSEELRSKLAPAMLSAAAPGLASDLASQKIKLEQRRLEVAHILGSHDGATELADEIHAAAVARAQASIHPNHEVVDGVWEDALAQLRRGVKRHDLAVLGGLTVVVKLDPPPRVEPAPAAPEPSLRVPKRRMPPMATLLALAMTAGLALPPREDK
jgi:hypothetical protein